MEGCRVYHSNVRRRLGLVLLLTLVSTACSGVTSRKYEYEEDVYLALDGSAVAFVNASVPALVALRGASLPIDSRARLDRQAVRAMYESAVAHVTNVTTSRRDNRRYVHVRIEVADIRRLHDAPPFAWSEYRFDNRDGLYVFHQIVGEAAGRAVGPVGWTGRELVAIRLHLPSRVPFHNAPSRTIERGNIIVWDQSLTDRQRGAPIDIEVHLEPQSILRRTLALFGLMMVAVAATFAVFIWFVRSRGRGH